MPKDNIAEIVDGLITPKFMSGLPENGSPLDVCGKFCRHIFDINDAANEAVVSIDANGHLSDEGKRSERRSAAKTQQSELRKVAAELSTLVDNTLTKARAAQKKEIPLSDSAQQLRAMETRQIISAQVGDDNLLMQTLVGELIETNDAASLDAIIDAPRVWPQSRLVENEQLKAARLAMDDTLLGNDAVSVINADKELKATIAAVENNLAIIADDGADEIAVMADAASHPA